MTHDLRNWKTAGSETFLDLYRILPGVPAERAFEELSTMLGLIRHLTLEAEINGDHMALGAARYLSAFAKAVADDIELGKLYPTAQP